MNTLVIAADLGRFRAYRITKNPDDETESPRIELIEAYDPEEGRVKASDLYTDSPGAMRRKAGIGAGFGERHGLDRERQRKLIKLAADSICALLEEEGLPSWHLSAGKSINNTLVESLAPEVRGSLP